MNAGIEPMVTFWPFQTTASRYWNEYSTLGYLAVNRTSGVPAPLEFSNYLVDQTRAETRAATFNAFWQGYGQFGFKTVWLDAAEPERFDWSFGDFSLFAGTDAEVLAR